MTIVATTGSADSHNDGFRFRRTAAAAGLTLCAGALIACSSTTPTATPATSSAAASVAASSAVTGSYPADKAQLCQARDQLKISITALNNPALLTAGTDGIKTALQQVQTSLTALVAAGKQDYQPQIDAVQTSLKDVETAVGKLGNGGGAQNLLAVGSAVSATGTSTSALFKELTAACGS